MLTHFRLLFYYASLMSNTNTNCQFKIEKHIAVPPITRRGNRKYPFPQMKIGESFYVGDTAKTNSVRYSASYYAIRNKGFKFTVRKEANGVRVWRIPV